MKEEQEWVERKLNGVPVHERFGVPERMPIAQERDIANFRKILIPMIRRIIPEVLAKDIVGVQPMTGPVGEIFALKWRYVPRRILISIEPGV